jgi:uncharacterized membrane protein
VPELTQAVRELIAETKEVHATFRRILRWVVAAVAVVAVTGAVTILVVYQVVTSRLEAYQRSADARITMNNVRICKLIDLQAKDTPPPSTERGRQNVEDAKRLRVQIGCK